jgi:hypothetical protein
MTRSAISKTSCQHRLYEMEPQLRLHEVPSHTLAAVTAIVCGDTGTAPSSPAVISQTQNAPLALWGAKQVAVAGQAACTALTPNWLSPYEWTLVADNGAIQHADTRSIAELINRRVGEAHEQEQLHKDASADTPTRLNTQDLRLKESTHVLKRPKSSAAVVEEGQCQRSALPGTTAR